jgi:hypothetical protein
LLLNHPPTQRPVTEFGSSNWQPPVQQSPSRAHSLPVLTHGAEQVPSSHTPLQHSEPVEQLSPTLTQSGQFTTILSARPSRDPLCRSAQKLP